jgi:hypothetical protein
MGSSHQFSCKHHRATHVHHVQLHHLLGHDLPPRTYRKSNHSHRFIARELAPDRTLVERAGAR